MNWSLLALLAAFGQAVGWALKKKALNRPDINLVLGMIIYTVASICFFFWWQLREGKIPDLSQRFFEALLIVSVLNTLAAWCAFKALDKAEYHSLMAFIPVTSVLIVPLDYFLLGSLPNSIQLLGINVVVIGGVTYGWQKGLKVSDLTVILLFATTLLCYAFASAYMAVMQAETGDGLFAAAIMHGGIAVGFLALMALTKLRGKVVIPSNVAWRNIIPLMLLAGIVVAFLENGPVFLALETGTASEVFSIKRLMPIFGLIIGYVVFKEKPRRQQYVGTALMMVGAVMVVWFSE